MPYFQFVLLSYHNEACVTVPFSEISSLEVPMKQRNLSKPDTVRKGHRTLEVTRIFSELD